VFGERLQTTPAGWVVVVIAILAMGWATVALASASSHAGVAVSHSRAALRPSVNKLGSATGTNPDEPVIGDHPALPPRDPNHAP
jgi:hypothetical protein